MKARKHDKSGASALVWIIAVIIAVVILIVAATIILEPFGDGDENGNGTATYNEGDFMEWTFYMGTEEGDPYSILLYTIEEIGDVYITLNITYMNPARIVLNSQETHILKNATFGATGVSGFSLPAGYTVDLVGAETLTTKWGQRTTDHYVYQGEGQTVHVWERNGFLVKASTISEETAITMFLTDSNISQITNP